MMEKNGGVFIIAEAGVNHNGSLQLAKKMAYEAKEAGVDAVKFQTFKSEKLVSRYADKADYQKKTTDASENQLAMLKKLELSYDNFKELKEYCDEIGILFLSTPFDLESIDFLDSIGMSLYKIPSGDITNYPYLVKIAGKGKKVILSTGMCYMDEIEAAVKVLNDNGCNDIVILHCNTEYPTPYKDVNLNAMHEIKEKFNVTVGYSDHTEGIEVPIAAVAMGAKVIEKHFTLDRNMEGPDHKASLEPDTLRQMVTSIRNIELALGNGDKEPSESECKNRDIARKSIVAACGIKKGEYFTESNITVKRPGSGISPMRWNEIIGTKAIRDFQEDEIIEA